MTLSACHDASSTQCLAGNKVHVLLCKADIETSVTEEISGPLAAPGVHAARDVAPMVVLRKLAGPEQLVNIVLSYTGQQTLSAT